MQPQQVTSVNNIIREGVPLSLIMCLLHRISVSLSLSLSLTHTHTHTHTDLPRAARTRTNEDGDSPMRPRRPDVSQARRVHRDSPMCSWLSVSRVRASEG